MTEANTNKVFPSVSAALDHIPDGASIAIGGFGVPQGWPSSLVLGLRDKGTKNLTIICNALGFGPHSPHVLTENHQISKLIATSGALPVRKMAIEEQIAAGEVEFETVPQGTLVERLRAGAAGIPAFYLSTGLGTRVAEGKEHREFDGHQFILERALQPDYAFVRAHKADNLGNLVFRGGARNFNPIWAQSARITIAEVDEVVDAGQLDPECVVVPNIFVDRVVVSEVPRSEILALLEELGRDPFAAHPIALEAGLSRELMALRVAKEIQALRARYVNLGFGLPTLVSNYLFGTDIVLQSQNGVLGYGPFPSEGQEDWDVYNAGGQPVTVLPGAAFFHSGDSFTMIRGGRIDVGVLGTFEVSETGDLANWWGPHMRAGSIGGAMDVAMGCKKLIVILEHVTKEGQPKIKRRCDLPVTARGCVNTIVTNLAVIDVTSDGLRLREMAPGVSVEEIQNRTAARLLVPETVPEMEFT